MVANVEYFGGQKLRKGLVGPWSGWYLAESMGHFFPLSTTPLAHWLVYLMLVKNASPS